MRGNEAVRRALVNINVRIPWGIQAAHWRTQIAEHDVHAYAPVGALVAALVGALADPVLIVHANVKEPYSLLPYPFTTNHNLRGDDCELVMATVRVSGSSVHVLPLGDDGYAPGFVLVLQNALCLLSK